jgi:tripartite-type tricarboxylate transporter receptor subunit TctC
VLTYALKYLLTMDMRRIVSALLVAAATGLGLAPAAAADYPARPISLLVAFTPGGPSVVVARILG